MVHPKRSDRSASCYRCTVASSPVDTKTLRSDARRNREQLVASAHELFAASGLDVPVEEITRHAGVGMGTLYRHFPAKEDLIDAVLEDAFTGLLDAAKEAAEAEDAWAGLTFFLERALAEHVGNRGLKDIIAMRAHGRERVAALRERIRPLLRRLIERAQEQGSLRADFTPEDLPLVFWSADRVIEATAGVSPDFWRRYLALLLDGLRAEAARPLPHPPLTRAQLNRVTRSRP
jgi:AcrR family transcriptional regulator